MADELNPADTVAGGPLDQSLDALQAKSQAGGALDQSLDTLQSKSDTLSNPTPGGSVTIAPPPATPAPSGPPPTWDQVQDTPDYQAASPEVKLVAFARWHDDAYNHVTKQPDWADNAAAFNQGAADVQAQLSKDAGGITPDQARVKIAEDALANASQQKQDAVSSASLLQNAPGFAAGAPQTDLSKDEVRDVLAPLGHDIARTYLEAKSGMIHPDNPDVDAGGLTGLNEAARSTTQDFGKVLLHTYVKNSNDLAKGALAALPTGTTSQEHADEINDQLKFLTGPKPVADPEDRGSQNQIRQWEMGQSQIPKLAAERDAYQSGTHPNHTAADDPAVTEKRQIIQGLSDEIDKNVAFVKQGLGVTDADEASLTGQTAQAVAGLSDLAFGNKIMLVKMIGQSFGDTYSRSIAQQKADGVTDPDTLRENALKDAKVETASVVPKLAMYSLGGKVAGLGLKLAPELSGVQRAIFGATTNAVANTAVSGGLRAVEGQNLLPDPGAFFQDIGFAAHGGHSEMEAHEAQLQAKAKADAVRAEGAAAQQNLVANNSPQTGAVMQQAAEQQAQAVESQPLTPAPANVSINYTTDASGAQIPKLTIPADATGDQIRAAIPWVEQHPALGDDHRQYFLDNLKARAEQADAKYQAAPAAEGAAPKPLVSMAELEAKAKAQGMSDEEIASMNVAELDQAVNGKPPAEPTAKESDVVRQAQPRNAEQIQTEIDQAEQDHADSLGVPVEDLPNHEQPSHIANLYAEHAAAVGAESKAPLPPETPVTEDNMHRVAGQLGLAKEGEKGQAGKLPEVPLITVADPEHGGNITIPVGATVAEAAEIKANKAEQFAIPKDIPREQQFEKLTALRAQEKEIMERVQQRIADKQTAEAAPPEEPQGEIINPDDEAKAAVQRVRDTGLDPQKEIRRTLQKIEDLRGNPENDEQVAQLEKAVRVMQRGLDAETPTETSAAQAALKARTQVDSEGGMTYLSPDDLANLQAAVERPTGRKRTITYDDTLSSKAGAPGNTETIQKNVGVLNDLGMGGKAGDTEHVTPDVGVRAMSNDNSVSAYTRMLAKLILATKADLSEVKMEYINDPSEADVGRYTPNGRKIMLNLGREHSQGFKMTFLHEVLHDVFDQLLTRPELRTPVGEKAYQSLRGIADRVLRETYKQRYGTDPTAAELKLFQDVQGGRTTDPTGKIVRDPALYFLSHPDGRELPDLLANVGAQKVLDNMNGLPEFEPEVKKFGSIIKAMRDRLAQVFVGKPVNRTSALEQATEHMFQLLEQSPRSRPESGAESVSAKESSTAEREHAILYPNEAAPNSAAIADGQRYGGENTQAAAAHIAQYVQERTGAQQRTGDEPAGAKPGVSAAESQSSKSLQSEGLKEWAVKAGKFLTPEQFQASVGPRIERGAEHTPYRSKDGKSIIKVTDAGDFGHHGDPMTYLQNVALTNRVFHSNIDMTGVTEGTPYTFGSPRERIITERPFVEGTKPTEDEIKAFLRNEGFRRTGVAGVEWIRADGIQVGDTHEDNFVKTPDGKIVPIDVVVEHSDPETLRKFQTEEQKMLAAAVAKWPHNEQIVVAQHLNAPGDAAIVRPRIETTSTPEGDTHKLVLPEVTAKEDLTALADKIPDMKGISDADKTKLLNEISSHLETEVTEPTPSDARNDYVDNRRASRGLPPMMEPLRRAFGKVWDDAMGRLDKNTNYAQSVIDSIISFKGGQRDATISDTDQAVLAREKVLRENNFDQAVDDVNAAKTDGERATAKGRLAAARDALTEVNDAWDRAGTTTAQSLAARRIVVNKDLSLGRMEATRRAAEPDWDKLPDAQKEKILADVKTAYDQLKILKAQVDAAQEAQRLHGEQADLTTAETGKGPGVEGAKARVAERVKDATAKVKTPLTDEQRLARYKKSLATRQAALDAKIAAGDFTRNIKVKAQLDAEAFAAQARYNRTRQDFDRGVKLREAKSQPLVRKGLRGFVDWVQAGVISNPLIFTKLLAAGASRLALNPLEQVAGLGWSHLPGFSKIAERAPGQGVPSFKSAVRAEVKSITAAFTSGIGDLDKIMRTGKSDLDVEFGKQGPPRGAMLEFNGALHSATKAPIVRASFERQFSLRIDQAMRNNVDVNNPEVRAQIGLDSYVAAKRDIFQGDNRATDAFRAFTASMQRPDPITGKVPLAGDIAATFLKTEVPVSGVPTNIVSEAVKYVFGAVTGSVKAATALSRGVENLSPKEADLIMQNLKKGTIGNAAMLLVLLGGVQTGGFYQKGEKRKPGDLKPGDIRVDGVTIPAHYLHGPIFEAMQMVGAYKRMLTSRYPDGKHPEHLDAIAAGLSGFATELPYNNLVQQVVGLADAKQRPKVLGEILKTDLVPQAVQAEAKREDATKRAPDVTHGLARATVQTIETGIPGLSKKVKKAKH